MEQSFNTFHSTILYILIMVSEEVLDNRSAQTSLMSYGNTSLSFCLHSAMTSASLSSPWLCGPLVIPCHTLIISAWSRKCADVDFWRRALCQFCMPHRKWPVDNPESDVMQLSNHGATGITCRTVHYDFRPQLSKALLKVGVVTFPTGTFFFARGNVLIKLCMCRNYSRYVCQ